MDQNLFFDRLTKLLAESDGETIYPCIGDLVINGLQTTRFTSTDKMPNRQDVTQYLAKWCRHAQLSEDDCRTWLSDYALSMLSPLSKSSPSAIRHSTKHNVKYTYKAKCPFACTRDDNTFRATCSKSCPIYSDTTFRPVLPAPWVPEDHQPPPSPVPVIIPTKRELYCEQFQSALQLISDKLLQGRKKTVILSILQEKGLKTRTGKEWTYTTLMSEIKKLRNKH